MIPVGVTILLMVQQENPYTLPPPVIRIQQPGHEAMYANTTGQFNAAFGMQSLYNAQRTTGSYNTACGYVALLYNISGNGNTSVGWGSMMNNIPGLTMQHLV